MIVILVKILKKLRSRNNTNIEILIARLVALIVLMGTFTFTIPVFAKEVSYNVVIKLKTMITSPTLKEGLPISFQKKAPNEMVCIFSNPKTRDKIRCPQFSYLIDLEKKKVTNFPAKSQRCNVIPEYLLYMYKKSKDNQAALITVKITNLK